MMIVLPQHYPLKVKVTRISNVILSLHIKYCTLKKNTVSARKFWKKIENKNRINF